MEKLAVKLLKILFSEIGITAKVLEIHEKTSAEYIQHLRETKDYLFFTCIDLHNFLNNPYSQKHLITAKQYTTVAVTVNDDRPALYFH